VTPLSGAAACAGLVARADPVRWRSAKAAPPDRQSALMALYAFNIEIARAPWVASEPLLAQIRLQWWKEAIEEVYSGDPPRRHEVVEPLAAAIRQGGLPQSLFMETIDARFFDAQPGRFADAAALERHLDLTAGHLMVLAAQILGAQGPALGPVRDFAQGAGMAAFLRALPDYQARGHWPLPEDTSLPDLAAGALDRIGRARARRASVRRSLLPALLPGALAEAQLRNLRKAPEALGAGAMELSEFERRARLAWVALTGRW
jgi:15-cis-phytoene synthase